MLWFLILTGVLAILNYIYVKKTKGKEASTYYGLCFIPFANIVGFVLFFIELCVEKITARN